MPRHTRLPAVGLLALIAALVTTPARSEPPKLTPAEKKKQVAEIEKQLAELKAKLDAVKAVPAAPATPPRTLPDGAMAKMPWRCVGPANMGGRVTALAVVESDPTTFFVATASGGLLKTTNNGTTFAHLFDDQSTVSIGDVAVAPSDPNVVWVGTGEANPRNSVSYGDGVYKSTDGGKTFKHMGLKAGFQTGRVLIHPENPDTVYVGVLGRLYGPNPERGLFKTTDGGKTWDKVLFVDENTGVMDARLDPFDPDTLLVATYERKRDGFDSFIKSPPPVPDSYGPIVTHGSGTALWKSTDAGKTWLKLTDGERPTGLPTVKLGRVGLDFSRKEKGLVYAIIDTEKVGTGTIPDTYLGVVGEDVKGGGAKLARVTDDSPAATSGLKTGDVIVSSDGKKVTTYKAFVDKFLEKKPGDSLKLVVKRGDKELTLDVKLGKRKGGERPPPIVPKVIAGFNVGRGEGKGVLVDRVTEGGPADKAGIKGGDRITKVDGQDTPDLRTYQELVADRKPGDTAKFTIARGDKSEVVEVAFAPNPQTGPAGSTAERRPYGLGLGGQQPNVQNRQGDDAFQTGGVFKSTDSGDTWTRVNSLNPRPMYFSKVRTDPTDEERVYLLGDSPAIWVSPDGGATFKAAPVKGVHPDAHALWIDPADGRHMVLGCDGGFYLTYDRGEHWDHLNTLALGQFYHVAVDDRRPYRVYGGLQDNGTWGGPSRTLRDYGPVNEDYFFVSGGDGFVVRIDPTDPDLVYFESQNGFVGRRNFRTGDRARIRPKTEKGDPDLRFNWNTPFVLSHHNPGILYVGAQHVWRSMSRGDDLKRVSPELTRTDHGSMTAISESPRTADVVWAGTDDGYVWVTKDGGANWSNVTENLTAAGLPGNFWVASLEASREKDGPCYVVFDAHRSDDDKPYLFVTEDLGATWKSRSPRPCPRSGRPGCYGKIMRTRTCCTRAPSSARWRPRTAVPLGPSSGPSYRPSRSSNSPNRHVPRSRCRHARPEPVGHRRRQPAADDGQSGRGFGDPVHPGPGRAVAERAECQVPVQLGRPGLRRREPAGRGESRLPPDQPGRGRDTEAG